MANPLERNVELYNDGKKTFTGKWDGKEIVIEPGECVQMMAGVAEHLIERHPDVKLRVEEILPALRDARNPNNPLQQDDRGAAFAGLKKEDPNQ